MAVATSTAILGAAALGTGASLYGASKAAGAQKRAARDAAAAQEAAYARQEDLQEPFRQAGLAAQNRYMTLLGLTPPAGSEAVPGLAVDTASPEFGKYARDFSMADFEADPGYGFRIKEGMKALESSAAARGGLLSGTTLKGTQRFGQALASQEYMNAFNRYQANRAAQLNPLQSLYGGGQSSANLLSNAAGQMGQGVGNAILAGGQARASSYANMASALNQGLSTGANLYAQSQYLGQQNALNKARLAYFSGGGMGAPGGTGYGPASNAALYSQYNVPSGYGAV